VFLYHNANAQGAPMVTASRGERSIAAPPAGDLSLGKQKPKKKGEEAMTKPLIVILIGASAIGAACRPMRTARLEQPCVTDPTGIKGEVRRDPSGKLEYFDGRCWTNTPPPATDQSR